MSRKMSGVLNIDFCDTSAVKISFIMNGLHTTGRSKSYASICWALTVYRVYISLPWSWMKFGCSEVCPAAACNQVERQEKWRFQINCFTGDREVMSRPHIVPVKLTNLGLWLEWFICSTCWTCWNLWISLLEILPLEQFKNSYPEATLLFHRCSSPFRDVKVMCCCLLQNIYPLKTLH